MAPGVNACGHCLTLRSRFRRLRAQGARDSDDGSDCHSLPATSAVTRIVNALRFHAPSAVAADGAFFALTGADRLKTGHCRTTPHQVNASLVGEARGGTTLSNSASPA
jgi:hypothetical protein